MGRDQADILRTLQSPGDAVKDPDQFLRDAAAYAELGIQSISVSPHGPDPVGWVSEFAENTAPRLLEIG